MVNNPFFTMFLKPKTSRKMCVLHEYPPSKLLCKTMQLYAAGTPVSIVPICLFLIFGI